MKRPNPKRLFCLALAVLMAAGSAACGTSPQQSSGSGDSTARPENDGPLVPYEEPVTITWAVQTSAVQQFFDGDTYDDNRWSRKIKEELNIDVEVAFSADISTDAYRNKLNAVLASGDLPDVFRWNDRRFVQQAYEAGYLADITDVFAQYANEPLKAYQTAYPDSFEGISFDGRLHGFPYMTDNFHQAAYLWIRDDWLENTNSQPPTTIEEMVELARKFTFEDPDGNGVDDTYGLALGKKVVDANYATLLGLIGAYGVPGYTARGIFYRGDDGKVTFPYIQPGMKDALALVRGMYEEGLIDPEFIVKDIAVLETDIANGSIGMMYHMNWGTWHPFNISYQQDGVVTRPYPIPTIEGIDYKMGIESNKVGDVFMVNANCENPEAIIKILNLYNDLIYESTDPEDFVYYWENEQYRLCPAFVGIPTELHAPKIFEALDLGTGDNLSGGTRPVYDYVVGFEDGSRTDPNSYGTWGQMFDRGTMKIALEDYTNDNALVTGIVESEQPDIWVQNSSVLESMVETAFTDIIIGNQPLDYFDQFVEDWLNAGGRQTLDELEEMYPAN